LVVAQVNAPDINGQLQTAQIAVSAITSDLLAASAVTETKISNNAITTPKILAGAVTANQIAAGSVIAEKIATNAVTADKILASSVTANKIATGTITANEIAGNTITGNKIVANTITGGLLATSGIITNSAQINNAVITNAKIENAAVDTLKIAGQSVSVVRTVTNSSPPALLRAIDGEPLGWQTFCSLTFTPVNARELTAYSYSPMRFVVFAGADETGDNYRLEFRYRWRGSVVKSAVLGRFTGSQGGGVLEVNPTPITTISTVGTTSGTFELQFQIVRETFNSATGPSVQSYQPSELVLWETKR
jgi:hypothetical protein